MPKFGTLSFSMQTAQNRFQILNPHPKNYVLETKVLQTQKITLFKCLLSKKSQKNSTQN